MKVPQRARHPVPAERTGIDFRAAASADAVTGSAHENRRAKDFEANRTLEFFEQFSRGFKVNGQLELLLAVCCWKGAAADAVFGFETSADDRAVVQCQFAGDCFKGYGVNLDTRAKKQHLREEEGFVFFHVEYYVKGERAVFRFSN